MEIVEEFTDEATAARWIVPRWIGCVTCGAQRIRSAADLLYRSTGAKFVLQALILEEMERFGVKTIFLEAVRRRSALEAHAPNHRSRS